MSKLYDNQIIPLSTRRRYAAWWIIYAVLTSGMLLYLDNWTGALVFGLFGVIAAVWTLARTHKRVRTPAGEAKRKEDEARSSERENAIVFGIYSIGASVVWIVVFFGSWIYCISEYGYLLGVGLGWLPSLIVATIVAFLWPLIAVAALFIMSRAS